MQRSVLRDLNTRGQTPHIVGVRDLHRNVPYLVIGARGLNTQYGWRTVLKLQDGREVFLPSAYNDLDDEALRQLNLAPFQIIYNGIDYIPNTNGLKKHILTFRDVPGDE